jgi:hypothetical protein
VRTLFFCGVGDCERHGSMDVADDVWDTAGAVTSCPVCGATLRQSEGHFELLDMALQRERAALAAKPGPLTLEEVDRLREIHQLLGHRNPEEFSPESESLVLKIGSAVLAKIRNEDKN